MPRHAPNQRAAKKASGTLIDGGPTIVIGIDFGTTYSGVAWARTTRPEQVNIITSWKSLFTFNSDKEKVPTSLCYTGTDRAPLWGYTAPAAESSVKWFKLCLLDRNDIPEYLRDSQLLQNAKSSLEKSNTHVVDAISDYLRELWEYTLGCIERAEGESMVALSAFRVVVTLPAIWPAYAQYRMKEAIEKADILSSRNVGGTTLEFVPEPEAAALATLRDMSDRTDVKPGDHFVVCDAGGGTVDVITYSVINKNPIRVEESVKGDGKLCGATFVDERFRNLVKSKLLPSTWEKLGEDGIARLMNNEWENGIKPQFCNDGREWSIHIPISSKKREYDQYNSSEISLTNQDIVNVFRPITSQIVELVAAQVQEVRKRYHKLPKFVILVGGFGRCPSLYTSLREGLMEKIEILQSSGARPWTAVCRGAAIRGLERSGNAAESAICSRIARASYGTMCNVTPWSEAEHHLRDKEFCPITRTFVAADQTSWFLRIGDTISTGNCIELGFHQDLEHPMDDIITYLIYSDALNPSNRCDETVKVLCQVRWSRIPKYDSLPTWTNSKSKTIRRLIYVIKMTSNGVSLDFEISHEKKIVASQNVAVDYRESGTVARRSESRVDDDGSVYASPERTEGSDSDSLFAGI